MAAVGARRAGWNLHPEHFAERHGLIVIIALGESLIVAGAAVAGEARTGTLVAAGAAAVAPTCLLWWSYFGWVKDALEERLTATAGGERAPLARDVYSLWHFPLLCGIIAYAVGVEGILAHPDTPVPGGIAVALGAGVFLFVASTAGSTWRAAGQLLLRRLGVLAVTLAALAAVSTVPADVPPAWSLAVVGLGLVVINVGEHRRCVPDDPGA